MGIDRTDRHAGVRPRPIMTVGRLPTTALNLPNNVTTVTIVTVGTKVGTTQT